MIFSAIISPCEQECIREGLSSSNERLEQSQRPSTFFKNERYLVSIDNMPHTFYKRLISPNDLYII